MKKFTLTSLLLAIFTVYCFGQGPAKAIPVAEHYEGGQKAMYAFIESKIIYPPMAKRNRIQGECVISFLLNEDGTCTKYNIVKNIGAGCADEALRVVKLLKFRAPGYKMQTSVPVYFKL